MARNTRLTLRRPASGEDAAGQPTAGWEVVGSVWADALGLTGIEAIKADAKTSDVKASFRINPRADVAPGWSVLQGSAAYEIKAVLPDLRRRMHIDLVCELLP